MSVQQDAEDQHGRVGPFVTFVERVRPDGTVARWDSRRHRKDFFHSHRQTHGHHGHAAARRPGTRRTDGDLRDAGLPARPQRPLPLRQRPQVEALPRHQTALMNKKVLAWPIKT
jgi:hypothetical protein